MVSKQSILSHLSVIEFFVNAYCQKKLRSLQHAVKKGITLFTRIFQEISLTEYLDFLYTRYYMI